MLSHVKANLLTHLSTLTSSRAPLNKNVPRPPPAAVVVITIVAGGLHVSIQWTVNKCFWAEMNGFIYHSVKTLEIRTSKRQKDNFSTDKLTATLVTTKITDTAALFGMVQCGDIASKLHKFCHKQNTIRTHTQRFTWKPQSGQVCCHDANEFVFKYWCFAIKPCLRPDMRRNALKVGGEIKNSILLMRKENVPGKSWPTWAHERDLPYFYWHEESLPTAWTKTPLNVPTADVRSAEKKRQRLSPACGTHTHHPSAGWAAARKTWKMVEV